MDRHRLKRGPAERAARSRLAQRMHSGFFLRGTLTTRERACGQPRCHCVSGEKHRSFYLIATRGGKYKQLYIPDSLKDVVMEALACFDEIQTLLQKVNEINWERIRRREL